MKALRGILTAVGTILAVATFAGALAATYYKGKMDTEAKFATRDMEAQKRHEEIVGALKDVSNQLQWNVAATEQLANEIPRAIQIHEYKMHPKEYKAAGSPTQFEIRLPKKPANGFDFSKLGDPLDAGH